ncbi:MAG: hypothetical protein EAZ91_06660 [Cytophagales bacterium]|nr:MAG: hypothetical protein EAZ91_06660 [Cytophagales bacterium]
MHKFSILAITLIGLSTLLTGCFENPSWVYEGAPVVELKNDRAGFATQPTNNVANTIRARTVRQGILRDSILVQLVGPHQPTQTDVSYTINTTSTAVEGTNFSVIGTKGQVTIPANSSFGFIKFQFLPGIPASAPATQTVTLAITLTGNSAILPSENYKTFTYTIRN